MSGHPALAAASQQVSTSSLGAKQIVDVPMGLSGPSFTAAATSVLEQQVALRSAPLPVGHKKGQKSFWFWAVPWQGSRLATQGCQLAQEMPEQTGRSRQPHVSLGESFPEFSVLLPHVLVSQRPRTARALAAPLPQLATRLGLSPAGLVNERVEDVEEESHDCGRGGQDKVSDAAFIWVLGGARTPLLPTGPPRVSCRPLGRLKLQLLFFSLQFLPDQRSLRCGNLRQHLENTMGNTPCHPPGQAAACKPSPVPSQPASPCSTVAVAPAPAALGGLRWVGLRWAALWEGAWAAAGQGLRGAAGREAGGRIPMEQKYLHRWVQEARERAAANHSPASVIPTGSFKRQPIQSQLEQQKQEARCQDSQSHLCFGG